MKDFTELLEDLNAFLVTNPKNVRYLTGFAHEGDAWALLTRKGLLLITSPLYENELKGSPFPFVLGRDWPELAAKHAKGRLGFEAEALSLADYERLKAAYNGPLVPTKGRVEQKRRIKRPDEIEKIRTAASIADAAFLALLPGLVPGRTERELALALDCGVKGRGAEEKAFDPIVASGKNGALPHARPTSRALKAGELVTLDWGARHLGYHSDATRTWRLGEVRGDLLRLHEAVHKALAAALKKVRPGVAAAELDQSARAVLEEEGLADYFVHALGHGVGLDVHEAPRLSGKSADVLEAGMVITLEPGVYLPGLGGVREEHLLLVTEGGYERLDRAPTWWEFVN